MRGRTLRATLPPMPEEDTITATSASATGSPADRDTAERDTLFLVVERAKREWEATFDAISDGIAVVDGDGIIQRANVALARMLGREIRGLPGARCCEVLVHHADEGCPRTATSAAERTFEVFDDDYHCFEEASHPRPDGGGTILVVKDVTKQTLVLERMKKLHEETRRSNRALTEGLERLRTTQEQLIAAEKIASIADLAAGLAHEINNPLGIVASNLDHLERHATTLLGLVDALTPLAAPASGDALAAAQEAADLGFVREDVSDVASDARLGADRIRRIVAAIGDFAAGDTRAAGPVSLVTVLNDAVIDARARHATADIDDPTHDADGAPAEVSGVRRQLHQALSRLLDNAVEANARTEELGGRVEVQVVSVEGTSMVAVEVRDSGPGVDDETARRAAAPFFTTHPAGSHLGLGLTIAAAIARRLGGQLSLANRAGGGAVARLVLPRA